MPQSYLPFLGLLVVWVSLPLLPAILIYWLFPQTKVAAHGPLASLSFKSTGAFAAYIVVFVAITLFVKWIADNISSHQTRTEKPYWTVEVPIQLYAADGKKIDNVNAIHNYMKTLQIDTAPPQHAVGTAKITLRVIPTNDDEWPVITFKLDKFTEESIDLKIIESETKPDRYWRQVKKPITIRQRDRETLGLSAQAPPTDEQYAQ